MSALKLKPLEDSNLYKRRTTSKENLLQTVTVPAGGMIRSRSDLDGTTSGNRAAATPRLAMSNGATQQPPPPTTTTHSPMHNFVSYPQYPQQAESYYQQPKTPIRMASGAGGGIPGGAPPSPFSNHAGMPPNTATPVGQKNVQFLASAVGTSVYDGSSAQQRRSPAVSFERPTNPHSAVTRKEENAAAAQQPSPGTYQNLPVIPPATPTTPGRRMESWEQFGRSNLQTVAAGGLVCCLCSRKFIRCGVITV